MNKLKQQKMTEKFWLDYLYWLRRGWQDWLVVGVVARPVAVQSIVRLDAGVGKMRRSVVRPQPHHWRGNHCRQMLGRQGRRSRPTPCCTTGACTHITIVLPIMQTFLCIYFVWVG